MTKEQAKQVLQLYRPGTADAADPEFTEALEFCEHDTELKAWLANHCAVYAALRAKFKKISVPEGLKEQIIAERPIPHRVPAWQKPVLLAGAFAAIALVISVMLPWMHRDPKNFAAYRTSMDSLAARAYYMDLYTNDLAQIRNYFVQTNAIADYVLPENLEKNATTLGCVSAKWQGKTVSMICFKSGRPLVSGSSSDLWFFVCNRAIAEDAPTATAEKPIIEHSNGFVTASWTAGNRTYMLTTVGEDKQLLSKFLPENAVL